MRPTGVVSKKVTGARTREVSELWCKTREARNALYRLLAERNTVSRVKPAAGWGVGGGGARGGQAAG